MLAELSLFANLGVTLLFVLFGAAVLVAGHLAFHFGLKKITHEVDVQDLINTALNSTTDISTGRGLAMVAMGVIAGLSELAFLLGLALIVAHVAAG